MVLNHKSYKTINKKSAFVRLIRFFRVLHTLNQVILTLIESENIKTDVTLNYTNETKLPMKNTLLILFCLCLCSISKAQEPLQQDILVMLSPSASWQNFEKDLQSGAFTSKIQQTTRHSDNITITKSWFEVKEILSSTMNIGLLKINTGLDESKVIEQLSTLSTVKSAELNYLATYRSTPDDALYGSQWNMDTIDAPKAWNVTTGGISTSGDTIVVMIIEDGLDINHEDLKENIWTNNDEIPNNGIDDDNNNYIDDYHGWYLSDNSDNHLPTTHGTKVAGIIGAKGNNSVGVAGINWNIKILPFSIRASELSLANIIKAYDYALDLRTRYNNSNGKEGAFVIVSNLSAGIPGRFPESSVIFCEVYNTLGTEGILSVSSAPNGVNYNTQQSGDIPTLCSSPFLITVTASDSMDIRTGSFGSFAVDLAAPGRGLISTLPIDNYGYVTGTSFAAPHVTGAVALSYSIDNQLFAENIINLPSQAARSVKSAIMDGTDQLDTLQGRVLSGGRLNIHQSINLLTLYYNEEWTSDFGFVNVYPNPVQDQLTVIFKSPNAGDLKILLFNATGQNVFENNSQMDIGFRTIQIDMSPYLSGTYFLMLKHGQNTEIRKIVVY